MDKRRLFIALILAALALALTAQAQDIPPIPQPTIDAAVSTLIAQTQQAPAQIAATRTIQAALQQALTGTAQAALPTPAPTLDVSSLSVTGTTDLDLLAGPARTLALLAPDGAHFAHFEGSQVCIYAGNVQQNCTDFPDDLRSLDLETVRWSPDSRYLVMTENFFQLFRRFGHLAGGHNRRNHQRPDQRRR